MVRRPDGGYPLDLVLLVRLLIGPMNYSGVVREYGYPLGLNRFLVVRQCQTPLSR